MTITETKPLTIDDMYAIVSSFRKEYNLPEPSNISVHCSKYGVQGSIHLRGTPDQFPTLGPVERWESFEKSGMQAAFHALYTHHAGAAITVHARGVAA